MTKYVIDFNQFPFQTTNADRLILEGREKVEWIVNR